MSSCRLVRVFCKKETNQKVETLRKELELKEKDIEEKDTKLNTLLQDPFGVIKLLATNYFNLRSSIEESSNFRTRQLTKEQAATVAVAVAAVSEKNSSDSDSDSDVVKAAAAEQAKAQVEAVALQAKESELSAIEIFMLENYGINIAGCYKSILDNLGNLSKKNIEDQLKKFINCCYNNYVVGLDAEEDKFTTEINEDTITFTSNGATDTLTRTMIIKYYNAPYKKVIINGFINIGDDAAFAFINWINLEEVVIGDSVKTIGKEVFAYCDALKKLVIGNSVETIGYRAFYYCSELKETLIIPDSVTSIGEVEGEEEKGEVFAYCGALKKLVIGNSVETIGKLTFMYLLLTTITIPNSTESIGDYAFNGCKSLTTISIGNSVKLKIGENAFYDCTALTEVIISNETAKILNEDWSSPSTVSSFYGSSNPVNFILPEE